MPNNKSFQRTPMRYAHTNGHTSCTYTENGNLILTCGSDGDMRSWQNIHDDDPSSKCLGEFILCVVHYDERILVSTDLNTVQAYTYPKVDRDGTEFRFTAPANCIRANKNFIAAGSEDSEIKIIKKDKTINEICLQGHNGPILSIDISCNDKFLASTSGDGTLKIWDLEQQKDIKTISGLSKCNSLENVKYFGTPSFHPLNSLSLAYANGKEIILLNTNSWEVQFTLNDENVSKDYSCCQFSPDGQYLAAGTQKGDISIWNVAKKETIKGETSSSESQGITSIVWNPKNNGEFAYCDSTGQLGTVVCSAEDAIGENDDFLNSENEIQSEFNGIEFDNDSNADIDNENCVSLEKLKNETMKNNGILPDDQYEVDRNSEIRSSPPLIKLFKQQTPFQSGSTPVNQEHRYLVWNNVGIVQSHATDIEGSIAVEFHDVSIHHALHMNNYLNHDMASLSSTVLALTSMNSNKLVCIALGASGSREWSVELPNCESIVAVAATNKLVAICTENRMLRIFSVMGTQREVISIPGNIVTMCGTNDKLMIAYHSAPASEDQHISALLLQTFGLTLRSKETRIPITAEKKLTWIGYSDKGSPVSCDTMGLIQMYSMKTNCWYPICDSMKHSQSVSNNFFIIDVLESTQRIQAVLCRGSTYPTINPRPMVMELPMQLQCCDVESEKSILEESLVRWSCFEVENSEKIIKEAAIKLFAIACRTEMESRAKELIEIIALPSLIPLAAKYASKLGRIHLADKLNELLPDLQTLEIEKEKEIKEFELNAFNLLHNTSLLLPQSISQTSNSTNSSPQIAPLSITPRRNPFKRSATKKPNENKNDALQHLTEKASGFLAKKTLLIEEDEICNSPSNETLKKNQNASSTPESFVDWFKKNKENLQKIHLDVSSTELTKIAMKEYKLLANKNANDSTGKRKMPDEIEPKSSGASKLAKFSFKR